jgi:FecR protein
MISAKAGLVYFVLGQVLIASSGPLAIGPVHRQLKQGEILWSESGRAAVLLNAGTVLRIGDRTRIRLNSAELTDTRVEIEAGSAVITVGEAPKSDRVEIQIDGAVVMMKGPSMFRFDANRQIEDPTLRVFAICGSANSTPTMPIRSNSAPKHAARPLPCQGFRRWYAWKGCR